MEETKQEEQRKSGERGEGEREIWGRGGEGRGETLQEKTQKSDIWKQNEKEEVRTEARGEIERKGRRNGIGRG